MAKRMDVEALRTNTKRLTAFAKKHQLMLMRYNDGLQIRLAQGEQYVDFWPSTGKYRKHSGNSGILPFEPRQAGNTLRQLFAVGKASPKTGEKPFDRLHKYVHGDKLMSMHQLFKKHYVQKLLRTDNYGQVKFEMIEWQTGWEKTGWRLTTSEEVTYAIELAKQYNVPIISV